jgi:hypothetical protein
MPPVVHIVSIVDVVDVDVIGPVPHRRPGLGAGINHAEPEASELETRRTFHHYDWNFVDAKPVAAAKMCTEAILRDHVTVVAAAFVPGTMFTSPVVCSLSFPDVLASIPWRGFWPSNFVQMLRRIPAVDFMRRASLDRVLGLGTVIVPMLHLISLMLAVLRPGLPAVVLLVNVPVMPVRIAVMTLPAVLGIGKHRRSHY